jgi:anthranilate 1,2-dioxygenase small subunit
MDEIRRRIAALNCDYAHCIDDDRLEDWPSFFTDDGRYAIIPRDNYTAGLPAGIMMCDGTGMMRDRVSALREANIFEPHVYRHILSSLVVEDAAGGGWRAQSSYVVIRTMQDGEMTVFSAGKFVDEIALVEGVPRFRERIVVCDSSRIDTLIVIPI